jgi:ABC-type multidrug transport system permease subunit
MMYLVVGVLIFGINLGQGDIVSVILVLMLGLIATIGLGMLLSQVFFYTATGKGGPHPILMFANTFANTFSGVAFPIEVLRDFAPWLYPISILPPQTHALLAIGMILKGAGLLDHSVITNIVYLAVFAMVTMPVGHYLMRKGLDRIRKEGYAPSPITIFD